MVTPREFGDPGGLAHRIVLGDEFPDYAGDQSLVGPVPPVFLMIDDGLAMDNPTEVAGRRAPEANDVIRLVLRQRKTDVVHSRGEALPSLLIKRREERVHVRPRPSFHLDERSPACLGQR